jgi:ComF family protein
MRHLIKNLTSWNLLGWFMPPICILCHQPAGRLQDLCHPCQNDLPILPQTCPRCAKTFIQTTLTCGACLKRPPPYDAAHALFSYQTPITKLIMELKFQDALLNAKILGERMAEAIQHNWYLKKPLPSIIIPMPLHKKRLQERGFNQSLEIARPIAKHLKIPLDTTSCQRIKATAAQAMLPAKKRKHNIQNAFTVTGDLRGRHIALLDDVSTTGFSMTELAKTCKKAGASQIDVWFCARAVFTDI